MQSLDFKKSYSERVATLNQTMEKKDAMSIAVGGEYETAGKLERALLVHYGLKPHHTVVDVGCGSGRLAVQLRDYLKGKYVGLDIVKELYTFAEKACAREDWSFYEAPGVTIPEPDNSADFICFFSVFTHLLHDQSYRYLMDAKRVLKPNGKIVISFLEFRIPSHWVWFQKVVRDQQPGTVLWQFLSRDALEAWAAHAGLEVLAMEGGNNRYIPIEEPLRWSSGVEMSVRASFGQSVCAMTKD